MKRIITWIIPFLFLTSCGTEVQPVSVNPQPVTTLVSPVVVSGGLSLVMQKGVGDNVSFDLMGLDLKDVYGMTVRMKINPMVLQYMSAEKDPTLSDGLVTTNIDNDVVSFVIASGKGLPSTGPIGSIHFLSLQKGEVTISFSSIEAFDGQSKSLVVKGKNFNGYVQ